MTLVVFKTNKKSVFRKYVLPLFYASKCQKLAVLTKIWPKNGNLNNLTKNGLNKPKIGQIEVPYDFKGRVVGIFFSFIFGHFMT